MPEKLKTLEKTLQNCAIGIVPGAYKTKRYWMSEGDSEKRAIEKTVNYALGSLRSAGVYEKPDAYISAFEEIAAISNAIAEDIKKK